MNRAAITGLLAAVVSITGARNLLASAVPGEAGAQATDNDVCIRVDEQHDGFSADERSAAIVLIGRQFASEGQRVVAAGCRAEYTVAHVRLGSTIMVTMSGGGVERQATAIGLDDLPAVYSQMVRSLVSGRAMSGFNVVDRTNVTEIQTSPKRVQSDSFGYARLGYGGVFGDRSYGTPAIGFGYRAELDSFALDVSFFNFQIQNRSTYGNSRTAFAGSLVKLEALRFVNPRSNRSAYFGGGMSWGAESFGQQSPSYYYGPTYTYPTSYTSDWHGSGLRGELTAGYEVPRASTMRMFVQTTAVLPFYQVSADTVTYNATARNPYATSTSSTKRRYAPSLVLSVGIGWHRGRR